MSKSTETTASNTELSYYFDFDCNLTHEALENDIEGILERAEACGVIEMLVPGATLSESKAAIDLCQRYPTKLFPTAGVHPYNASSSPTATEISQLESLASGTNVVAVGECGLDYSSSFPDSPTQKEWFQTQLHLACKLQKPLFLHERLAHDDFMAAINHCRDEFNGYFPPAVVHCFTGEEAELQSYISNGFYIGITGFIKKSHGSNLREMLQHIPLDRLVIETDAPYMGFPKCRYLEPTSRKRQHPNVPTALPKIVECIAEILDKTPSEIAHLTRSNAKRFLRI